MREIQTRQRKRELKKPTSKPAHKSRLRVAGLMSGTSADGVDVAIVDFSGDRVKLKAFDTFPYPGAVRKMIFAAFDQDTARVDDVCHLNFVLGEIFAASLIKLARRSSIRLSSIDLIGSHGQTICHIPRGRRFAGRALRSTLQVGEPSVIAERTGITTVADFRPRDVAAGGQGAPLVAYADFLLFRRKDVSRAIQNIGGIANVTYLAAGCDVADVAAFDTGPGNMMIDRVTFLATRGKMTFDADGALAARGKVDESFLAELASHPFLRKRPPKSTGREEFGAAFADGVYERARRGKMKPHDIIATVTAFTATSISRSYRRFLPDGVDEVILCGGGARNRTLVNFLRRELKSATVALTDEFGINADAKEAVSFAVLARETIRGAPGNVPSATGATRRVVLGKIVPGGS